MTTTGSVPTDRISIRADDPGETLIERVPSPGAMSVFVVLAAIAAGLVVALAFQATTPGTPFIILGGTAASAAVLGIVGLYRYQWFLLATLAVRPALDDLIADEFGTFQPSAILGILAIVVSLLHVISLRVSGNWRKMTPMGWAMLGFFVLFVPSFITSVDRGVSQAAMFGLASVMLLYLAMEQQLLADRSFIWKMLAASGIGLIIPVITGFVQFFWTGTLDEGGSGLVRIDGSFAHPNPFATYLAFAVLFMIGVVNTLEVRRRLAVLILTGLSGFLLIATFARGAWAAFLLGAMLMAARVNKKMVFVIGTGALAAGAVVPGVRARIENLTASTNASGGVKTDDSLGWRFGYWEKVWPKFGDNPISGIGIDATKTQFIEAKDPHNSFLQALVEGGILGGFAFFALLAVATIAAFRSWKQTTRGRLDYTTKMLTVGAITALFSVAVQLVTENVLLNTIVWWYLNVAMAYLAVLTWGPREPTVRTPIRPNPAVPFYVDPRTPQPQGTP